MARLAAQRQYAAIHKDRPYHDGRFRQWTAEATQVTPFEASEGVSIYVAETDLDPADDFLKAPPLFGDDSANGGQ